MLALIAAAFLAAPAPALPQPPAAPPAPVAAPGTKRPWTLLVYGAADNNADGPILEFMDKVRKAVDDDAGLDVLFLIDRGERFGKSKRLVGERFTGTRLYRLHRDSVERLAGGTHLPELTTTAETELDTADAATLGRFIAWGKAASPADHYALLIYSHANGRTMCPDEQSKRDMGIAEVTDKIGPEGHVDFLALELCEMGGIEIGYQWRPGTGRFGADVLLAIPNAGPPLDWDRAFSRVRSAGHAGPAGKPTLDPATMTAEALGRLVIEEGERGRTEAAANAGSSAKPDRESAACYDLREAAGVKQAVDTLARELLQGGEAARRAVATMRRAAGTGDAAVISFGGPGGAYVDLYDLCARVAVIESLTSKCRAAAKAAMAQTDRYVLASFGMAGYQGFEGAFEPGRNGVFIVLPGEGAGKKFDWYTPGAGSAKDFGRWAFLQGGNDEGESAWCELVRAWGAQAK